MVFRQPLHVIASWPAADLAVMKAYLDRRPPAEERIEAMFARAQAMWVSSMQRQGQSPPKPADFLTYPDAWLDAAPSEYATQRNQSLGVLQSLSARLRR